MLEFPYQAAGGRYMGKTSISQIDLTREGEILVTVTAAIPAPGAMGTVNVSVTVHFPRHDFRISEIESRAIKRAADLLELDNEDQERAGSSPPYSSLAAIAGFGFGLLSLAGSVAF